MPLLRFVVVFAQVLREQVAEREPVERVVDKRVERVVDRRVAVQVAEQRVPVQVVHKRVAVAEHIARVVPLVLPLSSRRVPH